MLLGSIAERRIPFFADRFQVIAIEQTQVGAEGHAGARAELASEWAASGGRPVEPSPSGREKAPGLGDPFEVMFTSILELEARASDKVLDGA